MAIDLPPALPPLAADSAMIAKSQQIQAGVISGAIDGTEFRVVGNRYLDADTVQTIIASSEAPSEAIKSLVRAYYNSGHLLVRLHYFRQNDVVTVLVSQYQIQEVRGDERIAPHFAGLVDDGDVTLGEYDRARVLAGLKSDRIGVDYSVTYQDVGEQRVAMVLNGQPQADRDFTDFILEFNNKGSRYLGRYFGLAGIKHRTQAGTEMSVAYQHAFEEWGESEDGDSLDQISASIDHPFTSGLYGIDLGYVEYERSPTVQAAQLGSCLIGNPTSGGLLCTPTQITQSTLNLEAEIQRAALRGQHVLMSDTRQRLTIKEELEYVDSTIEESSTGDVLLDERYTALGLGLNYNRQLSQKGFLAVGATAKAGLSSSGTLDDYDNFEQRFLAANPGASSAPDVVPAARQGEFLKVEPSLTYQYYLGDKTVAALAVNGQFADEQLPEQAQYVLGGMNSLSAYLPGVLLGDEGYHAKFELSRGLEWGGISLRPSIFIEHGAAWYNDTRSDLGDSQSVTDAGVALSLELGHGLESYIVVARNLDDDVLDEARLEDAEADFFWRLRLEI